MNGWYRRYGKRLLDLTLATAGFIILLPVLGITALIVRLKLGTPVFFKQVRPGRNGKPFQIIKFRTMTDAADEQGKLLPDEVRLTPFGQFLRRTSLDELPELWNVIRGEMSLVGPRPLLMAYLERYTPEEMRRHEVLPGITGWAQINGRNALNWEDKFKLDLWYVDHLSLLIDLRILFTTVWKVIVREGITQAAHATMPEFIGSTQSTRGKE